MSDKPRNKDQYSLEPGDGDEGDEGAEGAEASRPPGSAPPKAGPPPDDDDEPAAVRALDVCPNCGSPLGGVDVVVCMRCGYDMKQLKVIRTATGKPAPARDDDEEAPEPAEPLSRPGVGGMVLPLGLLGACAIVMAIGYLAGAPGLFAGTESPGAGLRLLGVLRMLVRIAMFAVAGLGGLAVLASMLQARVGDLRLALARLLGIFAVLGLVTYFNVRNDTLEYAVESILQAAGFVGLSAVFFRLNIKDALTLMGATVFAILGLLILSALVQWAAVPG